MAYFVATLLVCATITLAVLSMLGFSRARMNPGTRIFAWLCIACSFYAGGYLGEVLSPDLQTLLYFTRVQYTGLAFLPALIILMALEFDGRWAKSRARAMFALPSLITYVLVLFIDRHDLYYVEPVMTKVEGLSILNLHRGPWYAVQLGYLYLGLFFALAVFLVNIMYGNRAKKVQARYLLAGGLLPLAGNFFYLYFGTPYGLDISPILMAGTAILFALGFLRHRAFDLAPLARAAVFDQMRDAIIVVDERDRLVDFNRSARSILPGLDNKSVVRGVSAAEALSGTPQLAAVFTGTAGCELVIPLPDDTIRQFEPRLSRLEDNHKQYRGRVLTLVDITERATLETKLKEMAQIDELTGLFNRRHFLELARMELDRARRYDRAFGVAIMDMDGFKVINDTWGHAAGDEALRLVSRLCVDSLRSCDFMGRFGGDEFAFAFPECDASQAATAALKLANVVSSATLVLGDQVVSLSASVGASGGIGATCPELDDLLAIADGMMYRKKKAGRS